MALRKKIPTDGRISSGPNANRDGDLDPECGGDGGGKKEKEKEGLAYFGISDVPPWYMCIIFGLQHYLTMFGSNFVVPYLVSTYICVGNDNLARSEILSTSFFVSGVATMMQTGLGTRLPILQGGSFSYLVPTRAIMSLQKWKCPEVQDLNSTLVNATGNMTDSREIWQSRMREIQGAIIVSSLFQIILGFTGLIGLILRFIGPLVVTPVIVLVGLTLFDAASDKASTHWGVAMCVVALVIIFSQYMRNIKIPFPGCNRKHGCSRVYYPFFQLFPVVLAVGITWLLCYILTVTNVFPDDSKVTGYLARTDINSEVLDAAKWFRFPRPGQWGLPTVTASSVFGMLAGVLAGIVESVGDYYACARLSGAPPPPVHALNRGIGMEGIGCMWAGLIGSGNAVTSFSENIGAIGLTKVGSRVVVQVAGLAIIVFSLVGKLGAFFVTMPEPITGGLFFVSFSMVVGVGLSNLSYVDMNSSRNIFIVGFSIFTGISIPRWLGGQGKGFINTGSFEADQIITVLMSTSMFVGGLIAAVLDNTIPGTKEERGLLTWRGNNTTEDGQEDKKAYMCYELAPCYMCIRRVNCFSYLPFCPTYLLRCRCSRCCGGKKESVGQKGEVNPAFTNFQEEPTVM